jgi:hypothetical protein
LALLRMELRVGIKKRCKGPLDFRGGDRRAPVQEAFPATGRGQLDIEGNPVIEMDRRIAERSPQSTGWKPFLVSTAYSSRAVVQVGVDRLEKYGREYLSLSTLTLLIPILPQAVRQPRVLCVASELTVNAIRI